MRLSARTWFLLIAATAAFVLGYLGYRAVRGGIYSPTDAVYWSVSMFYGRVGSTPGGTPWQLDVGRFMALAVIAFAAFVATAAILRERTDAWWVRNFARDHAIVIGSGADALVVVEAFHAVGEKPVVTDVAARSREGLGLRAAGARVIPGDGTEDSTASAVGLVDAKLVVVITGDDHRNLETLAAATAALAPGRRRVPVFHVALDNVDLWRELSQAALASHVGIAIDFFNPADRAALAVLGRAAELAGEYVPSPVLIDGAGPLAIRTVVHVVRRSLLDGDRAQLVLTTDTGGQLEAELRGQEPWCFEAADLHMLDATKAKPVLAIVCGSWTDVEALARGAALARDNVATVLVPVTRSRSVDGLGRAGLRPMSLHTVSIGADALASELIESSPIEILARAKHEDYVRRALDNGESPQTNPSLVGWEVLPRALKESNRRVAETVGAHVAALGATLRPLAHAPAAGLPIDDVLLEDLARAEHDRWMASLYRDGWRSTKGPKDAAAKLHPLLVPWDDLSVQDREKDRDVFRGLPHMLALVGYELVLPTRHAAGANP